MVRLALLLLLLLVRPAAAEDLRIEVEASPDAPLVEAEVVYTVRLWRASALQHGYLVLPEIPDAIVEPLQETEATVERDGRRWRVTERRLALFPQRSGRLVVPPPVFSGRETFLSGRELALDVQPKPAGALARWTPAQGLRVRQEWRPAPDRGEAGAPLERSLFIEADGLTAAQIPSPLLPKADGLRAILAEVVLDNQVVDGRLVGRRTERHLLIPERSGDIRLPPLSILWWDVASGEARTTILDAQVITAAPGASMPIRPAAKVIAEEPPPRGLAHLAPLLGLPLAAVVLLFGLRRPSPERLRRRTLRQAEAAFARACCHGDARGARAALLAWAQTVWPERTPSLRRLAQHLDEGQLRRLEAALYAPSPAAWDGKACATVLLPAMRKALRPRLAPVLPGLDPYAAT